MDELGLETSCFLFGVIIGELFHRASLLLEEAWHLKSRYKCTYWRVLRAVFSNRQHQFVKVPALLIFAFLFLSHLERRPSAHDLFFKFWPTAVVWACLRMYGAFDNALEDLEILEENNAELGHGLAVNYWDSFLMPVLKSDLQHEMNEYWLRTLNNLDDNGRILQAGSRFRTFNKLILLLPDNCHFRLDNEDTLREERVFKCANLSCRNCRCNHQIEFLLGLRRRRVKQKVYWIFESPEDEAMVDTPGKEEALKNANKIFVIFDFPNILQSAIGPRRGWEERDRPGARRRNVDSFQKTLLHLIKGNDRTHERDILFLPFENRVRRTDGILTQPLSSLIRDLIRSDETREFFSSSSPSEYEYDA